MAVNKNVPKEPPIILNDMTAKEVFTDVFGNVIEGISTTHALIDVLDTQGLSHLCAFNNRATDIAASIMETEELWQARFNGKCKDRSPKLLIIHDAGAMNSLERYLDMEAKNDEWDDAAEKTKKTSENPKITDAPAGEEMDKESLFATVGFDGTDELMASIVGNIFDVSVNTDGIQIDEESIPAKNKKRYSAAEVKKALCHLIAEGNRQNIFVIISFSNIKDAETLIGLRLSQKDVYKEYCGIIFGSDAVRNTNDVHEDNNADCCFILPQKLKARLYDFSSSAEGFWSKLKKYF